MAAILPNPLLPIGLPALPVASARPIAPTAQEHERLKKMAYGCKTEHRLRTRAQVVLHAARGRSIARIAREMGLHSDTVRTWRGRFADHGLLGPADRKRTGRPRAFTALQTTQVKALACRLPAGNAPAPVEADSGRPANLARSNERPGCDPAARAGRWWKPWAYPSPG